MSPLLSLRRMFSPADPIRSVFHVAFSYPWPHLYRTFPEHAGVCFICCLHQTPFFSCPSYTRHTVVYNVLAAYSVHVWSHCLIPFHLPLSLHVCSPRRPTLPGDELFRDGIPTSGFFTCACPELHSTLHAVECIPSRFFRLGIPNRG